jgi:hypothetical protein
MSGMDIVMRAHKLALPALGVFLVVSGCAQAKSQSKTCRPAQAEAADEMVDTLNDWNIVNDYFKKYSYCDDGGIAEGSSEAIARLLVDHWDTLPELFKLVSRDRSLESFVLHHINTTLNTDDLNRIERNSSLVCPQGAASLCAGMREAAVQALK